MIKKLLLIGSIISLLSTEGYSMNHLPVYAKSRYATRDDCDDQVGERIKVRFYDLQYVLVCDEYLNTEQWLYYLKNIRGKDMRQGWKDYPHTLDMSNPFNHVRIQDVETATEPWLLNIPIPQDILEAYIEYEAIENGFNE